MSIKFVQFALDEVPGLNAGQRLTLVSLGEWANDDGVCWPSHDVIARRVGVGRRQVIRIIEQLEALGVIERMERRQYSNTYRIRCDTAMSHLNGDSDVTSRTADVTSRASRCDTAMSHEPSIEPSYRTVKEPSVVREQRGTRAPAAYAVTEEMVAWAGRTVGYGRERCEAEVEAFLDYHRAKGSVMKDWDAAFRTWIRNSTKFGRGAPGPKRMTPQEAMEEQFAMIERVAAEIEGTAFVVETKGRVQ